MANRYRPSKAMLRFFEFLAELAPNYHWSIPKGAIRATAKVLINGECIDVIPREYCPLTAACPFQKAEMGSAYRLAQYFGLSVQEGKDIMSAADSRLKRTIPGTRKFRVVAAIRPLILSAVGLPPEEPTA